MNRRTVILVIAAVVIGLALAAYTLPKRVVVVPGPQPVITRTSGVLTDLREPGLFSSSSTRRATVVLSNGASVDASVSPGCEAHIGESVQVFVLSWSSGSKKAYMVAGAK